MITIDRTLYVCKQCGHLWLSRKSRPPVCPGCRSMRWDNETPLKRGPARGDNFLKVVELRKRNPCLTLEQIGNQVGLTRERVRQLLNKGGEKTRHYVQKLYCQCGKQLDKGNKTGVCATCTKEMNTIPLVCDECGNLFHRRKADVMESAKRGAGKAFCNKTCQGKYVGKHYGLLVHPENAGSNQKHYDYDRVWERHLQTDEGAYRLSRAFNMPIGTVSSFLWKKRTGRA